MAAVLCVAALAPSLAAAVPTGAIEGTVTGTDTLEGIEGVEVCATRYEPSFVESCEFTAADGTYAIEGLAAGEYEVAFYGRAVGYRSETYPGSVVVGTEPVIGVDAELSPFSQIAGTVTRSSDGVPVEGVEVCAWELPSEEFAGCALTEADGSYLLEELEPGEYGIEFWPYETGQNLIGQFYDHRENWSEADPVVVGEGETVSGIDAELDPGATISGHVYSAASGAALEEIPVCAIQVSSGELWVCDWTRSDGRYSLPFLPGGSYKVVFSIDFEEWFGEEFEGEVDDGYPTEFWNEQTTLAAAGVITLATGQSVGGVDDHLGPPPPAVITPPPPVVTPPVVTPPVVTPPTTVTKPHKRCPKGTKRKKVKGKVRCVKKKHHHHGHRSGRPVIPARAGDAAALPPFEASERHRLRPQLRLR